MPSVIPEPIRRRYNEPEKGLAVYSGQRLDVDPARGLTGECDYLLAVAPPVLPLRPPLLTVVEAKKADLDLGLGQCAAEMVAVRTTWNSAGRIATMTTNTMRRTARPMRMLLSIEILLFEI